MKGTIRKDTKKTNWYLLFWYVLLAAIFSYAVYCLFKHLNPWGIDPDIISEVKFRKATWDQKSFFPEGFHCSNEHFSSRPVLVYWLYYGLTQSFFLAYRLEVVTMLVITIIAFYWFLTEIGLSPIAKVFAVCLFVTWTCWMSLDDVIFVYHDAYANFMLISIIALTVEIKIGKALIGGGKLKSRPFLILASVFWLLALVAGNGTPRLAMGVYLPLFIVRAWNVFSNFINDRKQDRVKLILCGVDLVALLLCLGSYMICVKLHGDLFAPVNLSIVNLHDWFDWERLANSIRSVLLECGIVWNTEVFCANGLKNTFVTLFTAIAGISTVQSIRKKELWPAAAMCVSVVVVFVFTIITTQGVAMRFFYIVMLLIPTACAVALDRWVLAKDSVILKILLPGVLCLCTAVTFVCSAYVEEARCKQEPGVLVSVADWIDDNGYAYVTANWDTARVITGYTEGNVDSQFANMLDITNGTWLSDKSFEAEERIGVPNILILTDDEENSVFAANNRVTYMINEYAEKVQEIDQYNLYALNENPFTLSRKIEEQYSGGLPKENIDYKITYPDALGFLNRNSFYNDARELVSDGTSATILWGPYMQSTQGTYDITLHYVVDSYTASDTGVFDVALNGIQMAVGQFTAQDDSLTLHDVTLDGGALFEARVWVPDGMIARIQSIEYQRIH